MSNEEILLRLRPLARAHGDGFKSQNECIEWSNKVAPLLRFNNDHYITFLNNASYINHVGLSKTAHATALNHMISTVQQAIVELEHNIESPAEVVAGSNPATNPTSNPADSVKDWHDKPLGKVGIGVFITVIAFLAVYLIRQYLGLAL